MPVHLEGNCIANSMKELKNILWGRNRTNAKMLDVDRTAELTVMSWRFSSGGQWAALDDRGLGLSSELVMSGVELSPRIMAISWHEHFSTSWNLLSILLLRLFTSASSFHCHFLAALLTSHTRLQNTAVRSRNHVFEILSQNVRTWKL